ncbi:MAG TPA: hypothetical protein DCZ94_03500 [Lentisphaeria bacterium]|nr:MAG: hypothetical protein A2X48_16310 [Lentisphaerae bacterium GWF2_49_21]HBC85999.1 hypothetical protein [Lentisphaeria bacterium]
MKKWPRQHVRLFIALLIMLVVLVATHILFVRPLAVKVRSDRAYISNTKNELGHSGWPLDPGRLETYVQLKKTELEGGRPDGALKDKKEITGIKQKSQQILQRCTGTLSSSVKKIFETHSDFTHDVTRLDYQEEYNNLEIKLASRDIYLSESILGLGEKTQTQNIYQLVLQVWVLDKLTTLVTQSGLRVQADDKVIIQDEKGRKKPAARLQFMPVTEYRLYDEDKSPYVMAIPIRLALYGTVESLYSFLGKIQSGDNFFPVSQIQMSLVPDIRNDDTQLSVEARIIKVEIECSAFYFPTGEGSGEPVRSKPAPPKILPEGA